MQGQTPRVLWAFLVACYVICPFLCFLLYFFPCIFYIPASIYQAAICQRRQPKCVWKSSFSYIFHSETWFYNKSQCKGSIYEWTLERGLWTLEIVCKFYVYMHFQGHSHETLKDSVILLRWKSLYFSWNCPSVSFLSSFLPSFLPSVPHPSSLSPYFLSFLPFNLLINLLIAF